MKEKIDIRISDKRLLEKLPSDLGIDLSADDKFSPDGSHSPLYREVRRVEICTHDPRYEWFSGLLKRSYGQYTWVSIRRSYSKEELEQAEVFEIYTEPRAVFEPAGVECGTIYDESEACPYCGVGRKQVSDLILDLRKAPRKKDIARTIADEFIVSERFAEIIKRNEITGIELRPVRHVKGEYKYEWFQPIITSPPIPTADQTRFGISLFYYDEKEERKNSCPLGHIRGLNRLSEVYIKRSDWHGMDFTQTTHHVGVKRGLLVPRPITLVSKRLWELMMAHKIKGFRYEVAHLI